MGLQAAYIVPHPPLILPEIGRGEERKIQRTIDAYQKIAIEILDKNPDTIVIASPHAPIRPEGFLVFEGKAAQGDFAMFGHPRPSFRVAYDTALARKIREEADNKAITKEYKMVPLDHGTLVPLSFFREHLDTLRIVLVAPSHLSLSRHAGFGKALRRAAEKEKRRIVFIASGDLSHRLTHDGPYGYAKEGAQFDDLICDIIEKSRPEGFLQIDRRLSVRAGECGLRPFAMLAGVLEGSAVESRLHSYEGPFGVGYAVASFHPAEG